MFFSLFEMLHILPLLVCEAHSKEALINVELDIPKFIGALFSLNRPLRSIQVNALRNGLALELIADDDKKIVDDDGMMELRKMGGTDDNYFGVDKSWFSNILEGIARRMDQIRPYVEIGPGSIKSPIVKYPPKFLEARLKHLMKIKEKMENKS